MKREIKFRAWDAINSEMIYPKSNILGTSISNGFIIDRYETIMQFTGLADKNGKEIYEGDILDGQMVVTWRNDLASFALKKQGWVYDHYFGEAVDPRRTEVIGNIYENPEILNL